MFGPAQYAVAKAVADSVAEGVIPQDQSENMVIRWRLHSLGGVRRQEDLGLQLSRGEELIPRAISGEPKAAEVVAKRN